MVTCKMINVAWSFVKQRELLRVFVEVNLELLTQHLWLSFQSSDAWFLCGKGLEEVSREISFWLYFLTASLKGKKSKKKGGDRGRKSSVCREYLTNGQMQCIVSAVPSVANVKLSYLGNPHAYKAFSEPSRIVYSTYRTYAILRMYT